MLSVPLVAVQQSALGGAREAGSATSNLAHAAATADEITC
jgi:hypothetical protein